MLQLAAVRPSHRGMGAFSFSAVQCFYMVQKTVNTLAEFEAEAVRFATSLAPRSRGATFVTLSGELGAGKTAFAKAVARALGVEVVVTSPTFVLEKIYVLPRSRSAKPAFERFVHIDAYRLSGGSELAQLGFDELMRDASNLVMLEWPERVADALPAPSTRISIVEIDGARNISYA